MAGGNSRWGRALAALPLLAVGAVWAAVAYGFGLSAGQTTFDGDCYAPEPAWAWTQAAIALSGLAGLVWASQLTWRDVDGSAGRALAVAAVAFVAWLIVAFLFEPNFEQILCPGQPRKSI